MTVSEVCAKVDELYKDFKTWPKGIEHYRYFFDIVERYFDINKLKAMEENGSGSLSDNSFSYKMDALEGKLALFKYYVFSYDPRNIRILNVTEDDPYKIADACIGDYGKLLLTIENRLSKSGQMVSNWVSCTNGLIDTKLSALIPIDVIHSRHFQYIARIICSAISAELYYVTSKSIIMKTMRKLSNEFKGEGIDTEFYDIYSIGNIIDKLGSDTVITVLKYDFMDKNYWPWKNNLIETLDMLLQKVNFTKTTYTKMKLISASDYLGMNPQQAMCMQLLKESVHKQLEFNQNNPWLYNPNADTKSVIDIGEIPSIVQNQLSLKALARMALGYMALNGLYLSRLFDLMSSGKLLMHAVNMCTEDRNVELIHKLLKENPDILVDG